MELDVEVVVTDKYKPLYELPAGTDTIVCIGGRGGMKTYEVSKFIAQQVVQHEKRAVIIRDEKEQIRESILNEIWQRYDTANEEGLLNGIYTKNKNELVKVENGETLLYTKGFKPSDNSKSSNLKGAANIDIAVIEEAEDIRDVTKYNKFTDSLRKEGCITIIMLNVPDINHWIIKRWFLTEPAYHNGELLDGYFKLVPKQINGFFCIQSTFRDNPFLPQHIVDKYNGYGNPTSHLYDLHYYLTEICGFASTGRKGQIFPHCKPIKLSDYLQLPYTEVYGQDFGTARPAALAGVKIHGNNIWLRQLNYLPLELLSIGKMYCNLQFTQSDKIVADSAEPPSINKLAGGFDDISLQDKQDYPMLSRGWYVIPAIKGPGSVEYGISLLKSMNIYIVEESTDFWDEQRQYIWETDRNGSPTGKPKDEFNHLWDCARYVLAEHSKGNYGISRTN